MAVNIGPKIGIDGDAQFRKELNNIIQQAKTLESEMKAVSSSFDENTDSQEKLEAQAKILNQQIEVQDQRIEMLKKGVEAATKEFGKGSTEALKWEQALNEAKNTINGIFITPLSYVANLYTTNSGKYILSHSKQDNTLLSDIKHGKDGFFIYFCCYMSSHRNLLNKLIHCYTCVNF